MTYGRGLRTWESFKMVKRIGIFWAHSETVEGGEHLMHKMRMHSTNEQWWRGEECPSIVTKPRESTWSTVKQTNTKSQQSLASSANGKDSNEHHLSISHLESFRLLSPPGLVFCFTAVNLHPRTHSLGVLPYLMWVPAAS